MESRKKFEFVRWVHHMLLFFLSAACIVVLSELVIGPIFQWFLHGIPYTFPGWNRAGRMVLLVLFIGFFAGTISWYYEKRSSGR
ncbi:hypothetical protein [Herminiimonas sp. KBW02]|uniref:hypothetical protein n=1 Tax=Herminiimonas sp. KBW02 TaxID=2153363 RepID=UPI001F2843F8|nr:hypothetical protein [Herminiimonas sp. KBW02]